jgi:hypothetical protein
MRKAFYAAAAATAVAATAIAGVPAASAGTDRRECVSKREYREVHEGMSVDKVQRIFDQRGVELYRGGGYMEKEYFTCTDGSANIGFQHSGRRQTWVMRWKYADFF